MAKESAVLRGSFKATSTKIRSSAFAVSVASVCVASCSGDDSEDDSRGGSGGAGQGGGSARGGVDTVETPIASGAGGTPDPGTAGTPEIPDTGGVGAVDGYGGWGQPDGGVGNSSGDGGTGGTLLTDYECSPPCGDGQMCCPLGIRTECMPADPAGCGVPDLTIDEIAALNSMDIDTMNTSEDPCLLEEACVAGPGLRRLLVFDTETPNIGTGDLIVGAPSMDNPDFEYSTCHDHYHFSGYAAYDLLDTAGNVAADGHKQSYCMRDDNRVLFDPDVSPNAQYNCSGSVQGISRGWSDVYDVGLPCQWVDITDVPPGDYVLRVRINPDRRIYELDYENNEIRVPVTIPPAGP